MVTGLPAAKVADLLKHLDNRLCSAGEEPVLVGHVGTSDVGKGRREVLEATFRLLGRRLKSRTAVVVFSEMLPVPRARQNCRVSLRGGVWIKN